LNKSIKRINIHKRNNKSTVNTSTHIIKTPTHYKTHTYTHTPHITYRLLYKSYVTHIYIPMHYEAKFRYLYC